MQSSSLKQLKQIIHRLIFLVLLLSPHIVPEVINTCKLLLAGVTFGAEFGTDLCICFISQILRATVCEATWSPLNFIVVVINQ